ncbi:LAME_0F04126g1_1 [Lachancea meyersii CBS 8951]|uniref:LAME_0F04126g1_1 n=1 Tax=Lachancea meyersii CBS 8951 TaxID=1266667 RepID=A0A1G4JRR0_9SACH|nr:LAME_0F04126g1_1 [Lachancea meyersii CBS 8951]
MAPPKKSVKMDLNSFLNDESFGESWAEEEVDLEKINIPTQSTRLGGQPGMDPFSGGLGGGKGSRLDPALGPERSERMQYDIPNYPPYRAVINNLPWDVSEEGIKAWVEDGLNRPGAVEDLAAPKDYNEPSRLKGFAFVTLCDREALEAALKFNATKLNERTVYVSVAAPNKGGFRGSDRMGGGFDDMDWGAARGSAFQGSARREEPDLDWGVARGSGFQASSDRRPREEPNLDWGVARGSGFQASSERRPRAEEPNIDWSSARGSGFEPSSERKPRAQEPNLDWNSARGSGFQASSERRPRREEPELDWGSARGTNFHERPARTERRAKPEPELNWDGARGSNFNQSRSSARGSHSKTNAKSTPANNAQETPKIQKSAYDVLATEDDDDDETSEDPSTTKASDKDTIVAELEESTAKLSVAGKEDQEWETVGKK